VSGLYSEGPVVSRSISRLLASKKTILALVGSDRSKVLLAFLEKELLEASADHFARLGRHDRQLVVESLHVIRVVEGALSTGHR